MNERSSDSFPEKQLTFPSHRWCDNTVWAILPPFRTKAKHKLIRWEGVDSHGHWQVRKRRCAEPYGSVYTNHISRMLSLYHHYRDALKVIWVKTALCTSHQHSNFCPSADFTVFTDLTNASQFIVTEIKHSHPQSVVERNMTFTQVQYLSTNSSRSKSYLNLLFLHFVFAPFTLHYISLQLFDNFTSYFTN